TRSTRLATELLPFGWAASSRAVTAGAWLLYIAVVTRSMSQVAAAPATAPRSASRNIDVPHDRRRRREGLRLAVDRQVLAALPVDVRELAAPELVAVALAEGRHHRAPLVAGASWSWVWAVSSCSAASSPWSRPEWACT